VDTPVSLSLIHAQRPATASRMPSPATTTRASQEGGDAAAGGEPLCLISEGYEATKRSLLSADCPGRGGGERQGQTTMAAKTQQIATGRFHS
jgi:hypothetical protein